ncbi:hypothetical protein ASC99_30920 [Kitasatospora sp. Root107]|nr:hypothetical protein ASC99_30920 [Kitasatospora sp. Root107]
MGAQHVGEDGDRVVALEGDERGCCGQPLTEGRPDALAERGEALGQVAQERDRGAVGAQRGRPLGELRLPGRRTDHGLGEARVPADGPDDRHGRIRLADQQEEGGRALLDECVAHGRGGEFAHVEFDHGAAACAEVLPQDAGPGGPVDARLGCHGDPTVARAVQEVRVDPPAAGLRRGEPGDPFRRLVGERVEHG